MGELSPEITFAQLQKFVAFWYQQSSKDTIYPNLHNNKQHEGGDPARGEPLLLPNRTLGQ